MGYFYDALENHFIWADKPNEGIPQLMWHITNHCKLNCKFCFSKKGKEQMSIDDLNQYIEKFRTLKVQKIDLSGGEPLLYGNLPKICEALSKAGIYITITTRAVGLESNEKWILNNWKQFTRIIVSVDVPCRQSFMELTGNQEAWDKTIRLLQQLRENRCTNVRVNTVVTPYLLNDTYLSKLADLIEQCCCKEWCLIEPHPANRKETFDEVKIQYDQFRDIIRKAKKISKKKSTYRLLIREQKNYTDYWVLYPDGILAKHTDGERDVGCLPFLETTTNDILDMVKDKIWVPEGNK